MYFIHPNAKLTNIFNIAEYKSITKVLFYFCTFKFWFHEEPSKNQIQNGSRMVLVHPITNHQSNNLVDQQKLNSKFQESICLFKEIRFNSIWFYITEVVGNCTKWPTRSFIYNFTKSLMKRKQVHTELFPSVYLNSLWRDSCNIQASILCVVDFPTSRTY